MKTKLSLELRVLGWAILITLIIFTFFTFPWWDNFKFFIDIQEKGPIKFAIWQYNNFDGRAIKPFGILRKVIYYYTYDVKLVNLVWTITLILTGWLAYRLLILNRKEQQGWKEQLVFSALIAGILWISMYPGLDQVLYWYTGGGYTAAFFIFLFSVYLLERSKFNLWLFLLAFLNGLNGHVYLPITLVYFVFYLLNKFLQKELSWSLLIKSVLIFLVPFLIGELIVIKAPGNEVRSENLLVSLNFYVVAYNLVQIISFLTQRYLWFLVLGGILMAAVMLFVDYRSNYNSLFSILRWFVLLGVSVLLFAPVSSVDGRSFDYYFPDRAVINLIAYFAVMFIGEVIAFLVRRFLKLSVAILQKLVFISALLVFAGIFQAFVKQYSFYHTQYKEVLDYINSVRYHKAYFTIPPYNAALAPFEYEYNYKSLYVWWKRYYKLQDVVVVGRLQQCDFPFFQYKREKRSKLYYKLTFLLKTKQRQALTKLLRQKQQDKQQ